jgi:hypothetical protein
MWKAGMLLREAARVSWQQPFVGPCPDFPALPPCHHRAERRFISDRPRPLTADHVHLPHSAAREVSEERGNDATGSSLDRQSEGRGGAAASGHRLGWAIVLGWPALPANSYE